MRFFNTEGPVKCDDHYCLPPLSRLDLGAIRALIAQKKCFLLHAPRQTGKTSCLLALADHLNQDGDYYAVYANIEAAQPLRENVDRAMATIVTDIAHWARLTFHTEDTATLARQVLSDTPHTSALAVFLARWCQRLDRPLVLTC